MGAQSLPPAWQLYLKDHRVSTFKNWPFLEGCACTPERMAAAGFIHCPTENEPDLAQCFFCFKELEGWEPDDDPIEEHKKHSSGCAFLSVKKQFEELTLSEFLKLDKERTKNKIDKIEKFFEKREVVNKAMYSMQVLETAVLELGGGLEKAFEVRGQFIFCEVPQMAKETNNKQKEFEETAKKVRCAIEQLAALE